MNCANIILKFNGTYRKMLASLKIMMFGQVIAKKWRACLYLGLLFFGHDSVIFERIWLNFCEVPESIIYRLVMKNPSYHTYSLILTFWVTFGGKMSVTTTCALNDLGPQDPIKNMAHLMDPLIRLLIFPKYVSYIADKRLIT